MTPSDNTAPTDAELVEIAKKAAADFVSSSVSEAPGSECPPGLLTALYNIWGLYRQVDGAAEESRIASGLMEEDAAFFTTFNPARVLSLLERLAASEASRLSVEGEVRGLRRIADAAREYLNGWCQDEAADDGPHFTGRGFEQHEAAKALKDALSALAGAGGEKGNSAAQDPGRHPCADAGPYPRSQVGQP